MSTVHPQGPADAVLAERYGRRGPGRRWPMVAGIAALAIAGVGWVVWAGIEQSFRPVTGSLQGYRVLDEHTTEVTIAVHREDGEAARCEVYAQADDHSIVGERTVELPPGRPGSTTVVETITTERRAVNGVLRSCEAAGAS